MVVWWWCYGLSYTLDRFEGRRIVIIMILIMITCFNVGPRIGDAKRCPYDNPNVRHCALRNTMYSLHMVCHVILLYWHIYLYTLIAA